MELKVRYFGQLTELVGKQEEEIQIQSNRVSDLKQVLFQNYPILKKHSFQIAQNNQIIGEQKKLETTTVDLFPPFSGG